MADAKNEGYKPRLQAMYEASIAKALTEAIGA